MRWQRSATRFNKMTPNKFPILAVFTSLLLAALACNLPSSQQAAGPSAPTLAAFTLAAYTSAAPAPASPTVAPPTPAPPTAMPLATPSAVEPVAPALPASPTQVTEPPAAPLNYVAQLSVENHGYVPEVLELPAGQPVELHLVTNNTRSCSRAFVIPALNVEEILPETGDVMVNLPAQPAGTDMDFMCSMGMYVGVFQFR